MHILKTTRWWNPKFKEQIMDSWRLWYCWKIDFQPKYYSRISWLWAQADATCCAISGKCLKKIGDFARKSSTFEHSGGFRMISMTSFELYRNCVWDFWSEKKIEFGVPYSTRMRGKNVSGMFYIWNMDKC